MRPLQDIEQLPVNLAIDPLEEGIDLEIEGLKERQSTDNEGGELEKKQQKPIKPHIIRRNVEDYLEKKALERYLCDVFDSDYLLN
jgi:hypothetical protein